MSQQRVDYGNALAEARRLLDAISDNLTSHQQRHASYPSHGAIGDVRHVAYLLREIHDFIRQELPNTEKGS